MQTIKVECSVCNSTGLCIGFAEPKGAAVVCVQCGGDGCEEIIFTPFIRRKGRRGIHTVSRSCGCGVGSVGISITYNEFKQGKMP